MAKKRSPYEEVLASFQSRQGWFESTPYQWKQVDPHSKGEKKTLFGLCRACMQGDCATLVHLEDGWW